MKILSLIGARPQFIKEAVIHAELKKRNISEIIVHYGQHYDVNMSGVFFRTLDIRQPDFNLGIGSGHHGEMTGKIMIEVEKLSIEIKPDVILVYGDTNTTLAGALVAAKLKIQLAHVEAGIRMFPKEMPEEINRVVVDRISNSLFCPSLHTVENLKKEGIIDNVHLVGDVMFDLYLKMKKNFRFDLFENLKLEKDQYILLTMHRDYNVDDPRKLEKLLRAIGDMGNEIKVVFPIHPRTKKRIEEFNLEKYIQPLTIIPPCDYLNLMGLVKNSYKVVTAAVYFILYHS